MTGGRLRSLDVARGLVVGLSALLSHIPDPAYTFSRHADWYGLHLLDFILPGFLALFGAGISLAYRRGVNARRLARRTFLLLLIGLLFNAVVGWDFSLGTWRLTGVLQLFAIVGLFVTLITRVARSWMAALLVAAVLLAVSQAALSAVGSTCAEGLPQPQCNPSAIVDPEVFGQDHIYRQGERGYDPEGLPVMLGASATVLFGYAAGEILWRNRSTGASLRLLGLALALLAITPLAADLLPINKRIWTPSYALITAAAPIGLLALMHALVDRLPSRVPGTASVVHAASWLPEAFGRNSLLVYFGKYLVAAVLAHVAIAPLTGQRPIAEALQTYLTQVTARPALFYMAIMFSGWALLAAVLHKRRVYLKV